MENNIALPNELLTKCLRLFKQYELNKDEALKKEGIHLLELTKQNINKRTYITYGAKWGGCLEYLTQKYYLDFDTDDILYELDVYINNQLNNNAIMGNSIRDVIWTGDYFLLRYLNEKSQMRFLSKQSICSILSLYKGLFTVPHNQKIYTEALFFFPLDICIDLKIWLELLLKKEIYTKEVYYLLNKICELEKDDNFLSNEYVCDQLRQEIRSFLI